MIRILTDSAADLTPQELERYGISSVPLSIHFGEDTYRDGETLDKRAFYEMLRQSDVFPKTSQPSPADFEGYFEDAKAAGDEIIQLMESKRPDPAYPLFGLYTYDRSNCDALLARMEEHGQCLPVEDCLNIGPSIGSHVGVGAYGVAYIAAE